jgi:hypothetical protein
LNLSDWPPPPLFESLLFENFWPGVAVFAAAGLMLLLFAWRRRQRSLLIAAFLCDLLLVANILLATFVTTNREALREQNRQLVQAFVANDMNALSDIFAEQLQFQILGDPVGSIESSDDLLQDAERVNRQYQIDQWSLRRNAAAEVDGQWRSYMMVDCQVTLTGSGVMAGQTIPTQTEWQLTWRQEGDHWRLAVIDWLSLNKQDPPRNIIQ